MPFKNIPPLYSVWQSMLRRCYTPTTKQFADYGGRGIRVCAEWRHSYAQFAKDMGCRPEGSTLDRIDNNADYSPVNCRWATRKEQQRNQRWTVWLTIEGVTYKLADLADKAPYLKRDTIQERAERGLSLVGVLTPERHINRRVPVEAVAARMAKQRAATHCAQGHEYTADTERFTPQGWRYCRQCRRKPKA